MSNIEILKHCKNIMLANNLKSACDEIRKIQEILQLLPNLSKTYTHWKEQDELASDKLEETGNRNDKDVNSAVLFARIRVLLSHDFNKRISAEDAKGILGEAFSYLCIAPFVGIDKNYSLITAFKLVVSIIRFFDFDEQVIKAEQIWILFLEYNLPFMRCLDEISNNDIKTAFSIMIRGINCLQKYFELKSKMSPFINKSEIVHEASMVETALGDGGLCMWIKRSLGQ